MFDVLAAKWIDPEDIRTATVQVKYHRGGDWQPNYLVVTQKMFHHFLMAISLHGLSAYLLPKYKELGIKNIIWAEYLSEGEFELASGVAAGSNFETIKLKD